MKTHCERSGRIFDAYSRVWSYVNNFYMLLLISPFNTRHLPRRTQKSELYYYILTESFLLGARLVYFLFARGVDSPADDEAAESKYGRNNLFLWEKQYFYIVTNISLNCR